MLRIPIYLIAMVLWMLTGGHLLVALAFGYIAECVYEAITGKER